MSGLGSPLVGRGWAATETLMTTYRSPVVCVSVGDGVRVGECLA
jgi:hypothetical protein